MVIAGTSGGLDVLYCGTLSKIFRTNIVVKLKTELNKKLLLFLFAFVPVFLYFLFVLKVRECVTVNFTNIQQTDTENIQTQKKVK